MKTLDVILLFPLAYGAWVGYRRGILIEVISIAAFIISVVAGFKLLGWGIEWLTPYIGGGVAQRFLPYFGFSVIFFPIIFLIVRLGWLLRRTIKYTLLGSFDSLAGGIAGIFAWAFGVSVFLWLTSSVGIKFPENTTRNTYIYPIIKPLAPNIIGKATGEWLPKAESKYREMKVEQDLKEWK
ncbi:MAG: CvpA family protein [Spirosomataceae bacterium]